MPVSIQSKYYLRLNDKIFPHDSVNYFALGERGYAHNTNNQIIIKLRVEDVNAFSEDKIEVTVTRLHRYSFYLDCGGLVSPVYFQFYKPDTFSLDISNLKDNSYEISLDDRGAKYETENIREAGLLNSAVILKINLKSNCYDSNRVVHYEHIFVFCDK